MYTYKIHIFFIDIYNIIIKYDKSYYTYIKFFNKTILKCLLYFELHFYEVFLTFSLILINFRSIDIFFQNSHQYISNTFVIIDIFILNNECY